MSKTYHIISMKQWTFDEARRRGVTERTIRNLLSKKKIPMPEHRRVNARVIEVFAPMEGRADD